MLEYCSGDVFNPSCPAQHVIVMTSALYGRMAIGHCVTDDQHGIGCGADVISVADELCSARRACDVQVTNDAMDSLTTCDLALRVYLEASYTCVAGACGRGCDIIDCRLIV